MLRIMMKSIDVWLLIVIAAILNGGLREIFLTPLLGAQLSLPISGITLSVLVFVITYLSIPFLSDVKSGAYLRIGLFWIILTLSFEYLFGHYVMGKSWNEINQVFDVQNGNLFIVVLFVTALSPWTAAKLKGLKQ